MVAALSRLAAALCVFTHAICTFDVSGCAPLARPMSLLVISKSRPGRQLKPAIQGDDGSRYKEHPGGAGSVGPVRGRSCRRSELVTLAPIKVRRRVTWTWGG